MHRKLTILAKYSPACISTLGERKFLFLSKNMFTFYFYRHTFAFIVKASLKGRNNDNYVSMPGNVAKHRSYFQSAARCSVSLECVYIENVSCRNVRWQVNILHGEKLRVIRLCYTTHPLDQASSH